MPGQDGTGPLGTGPVFGGGLGHRTGRSASEQGGFGGRGMSAGCGPRRRGEFQAPDERTHLEQCVARLECRLAAVRNRLTALGGGQ